MSGARTVAFIVVTYESADLLGDFLSSVEDAASGREWQLIAVDNASTDASASIVRDSPVPATVVELPDNLGYAAGINAGIGAATGDPDAYIVLNPDVRLGPGSVDRLLLALDEPGVGIAVPRLEDGDGHLLPSLRRDPTVGRVLGEALLGGHRAGRIGWLGEMVTDAARYDHDGDAEWASGAVMAISAAVQRQIGAWDESFFLYSEETDFALRSRDAGWRIRYVAGARTTHLGGESDVNPRLWSLLSVNKAVLFRRRHGALHSAVFRAALIFTHLLRVNRPTNRAALRALVSSRAGRDAAPPSYGVGAAPAPTAPPYVSFASVDWWYHNQAHSDFQLMRHIAATRDVLVVNSIAMRMPLPGRSTMPWRRITRKARSIARGTRRPLPDVPRFRVLSPVIIPIYGREWGRRLNSALVRQQVRRQLRRIGTGDPIVMVTVPTAAPVIDGMVRRRLIYNRSDKHSAFDEVDTAYIERLEDGLLRGADQVVYVSKRLQADDAGVVGERGVFLDHGVDLHRFRTDGLTEPADAAGPGPRRPRVGFFGGFDDYVVDFDLLERLAKDLPDAELLLIGDATCSMERLTTHDNVRWLGHRPYDTIPGYGSTFDVAIMPWLDNEWIRYANPIKLKEYLALGLAVVTTYFPEVDDYRDAVRVARDPDDFIRLVRDSLADGGPGTPASRRARVADSSWASKAAMLVELCERDRPEPDRPEPDRPDQAVAGPGVR